MRKTLLVSKGPFFHVQLCLGSTIRKKMSQLSQQLVENFNIKLYGFFFVNANDITLPKIVKCYLLIKINYILC